MDTYEIELEPAEPDGFTAIVPALPGLVGWAKWLLQGADPRAT